MSASPLSDAAMLLTARTFEELHDRLPGLNVEVPPQPAPRDNEPEFYSIVRFLSTVPFSLRDFPLQLAKDESPDFTLRLAHRSIGIEHVQAYTENSVHEAKLRAGLGGEAYLIRPAAVAEPRKSKKQLLKEIGENRFPPPMVGDSVERRWAEAMRYFIEKKMAVAQKPGYRPHDEHWLAIYDNWPSFALELQHALGLLQEQFPASDPFAVFSRVFILTGGVLVELARVQVLLHRLNQCLPT
jgi:hypothetical protein